MPVLFLPRLLFTLISLAMLGVGVYLLTSWFRGYDVRDVNGVWHHLRGPTWRLYAGGGLLGWSFLGRFAVLACMPGSTDDPALSRGAMRTVVAPGGSKINVEISGRADGPTLVLTHGWGLNAMAWSWARRDFGRHFRIVTWDLPGLGRSEKFADGKYSIDKFAAALATVILETADRPVILVGHSIGGMTAQTLFRARPDVAKSLVAGVILLNTTYENPLRTMVLSKFWLALQKPLLEPMCWVSILISPLAWLSAWHSYLSGSSQLAMRLTGFGRYATRKQVDDTALMSAKGSPAVQAKGNLAMFHWDARDVLPAIPVPMLVFVGERDIVTLPIAGEIIASAAPRAELALVEGVGHMGFMERAADYNSRIAAFAERVLKTPA
jgi:pimeloyl-ACP methyl ester carboxylesterase